MTPTTIAKIILNMKCAPLLSGVRIGAACFAWMTDGASGKTSYCGGFGAFAGTASRGKCRIVPLAPGEGFAVPFGRQ